MRIHARRVPGMLAATLMSAACATASPRATRNPAEQFVALQDSLASLQAAPAGDAGAPRVRIVIPLATGRDVEAHLRMSDDGYALVVAVDLDRRIRVLYPQSPSGSGFARADAAMPLPRFFAGFGGTSAGIAPLRLAYSPAFARLTPFEGGGFIVAVASDRMLQLQRLAGDRDEWDDDAIQDLLFGITPGEGARALARSVTMPGQEFTTDVESLRHTRFPGAPLSSFAASGCLDPYSSGMYGDALAQYAGDSPGTPSFRPVGRFVVGDRVFIRYAQDDGCGHVTYVDIPRVPLRPPTDSAGRIASDGAAGNRGSVPRAAARSLRLLDADTPGDASPVANGNAFRRWREREPAEPSMPARTGAPRVTTPGDREPAWRPMPARPPEQPAPRTAEPPASAPSAPPASSAPPARPMPATRPGAEPV